MNKPRKKILIAGIFIAVLCILTTAFFCYRQIQEVNTVSARVEHTQNVLLRLNDLYQTIIEHAGLARNFALYGREADVASIQSTGSLLQNRLENLKLLVKKNGRDPQYDSLEKYINKRIEFSDQLIRTGIQQGPEAVWALYLTGIGRGYNNLVLSFTQQIQFNELNMLQQDEQKNSSIIRTLSFCLAGLLAVIMILVIIIIQKLRSDISQGEKRGQHLKKFNEELEQQVKTKTAGIKASEERLESSQKNLQQVLSSMAENFYVIDRNYRVTLINEAAQKNLKLAWGHPVVVGTSILDHIPSEKDEPIRQSFEKVFAGQQLEYELQLAVSGLPSWILVSYKPVQDEQGSIIGASVVTKDITGRKKAEEEKDRMHYLLNKRIKELTTLYKTGQVLQFEEENPDSAMQSILSILPQGWQYPNITGVRIELGDKKYQTASFNKCMDQQSAKFFTSEGLEGLVEIAYLEKKPAEDEGPFLNEERHLINMIAEMIKLYLERVAAANKIRYSYEQTRLLASHIEHVREEEKIKIAREIHDELGQQLTGLKMDVAWLGKRPELQEKTIQKKIQELTKLLDNTVNTIRRIATELRPGILDDLGLVAAMQWQSQEFEKRSGVQTQFNYNGPLLELPANVSTSLFRIFQESLTNVARHAGAGEVIASLDKMGENIILKISDNGKGFDVNSISDKKTLGLLGMQERIISIGGRYEINSQPGKGTSVIVSVPLKFDENFLKWAEAGPLK